MISTPMTFLDFFSIFFLFFSLCSPTLTHNLAQAPPPPHPHAKTRKRVLRFLFPGTRSDRDEPKHGTHLSGMPLELMFK